MTCTGGTSTTTFAATSGTQQVTTNGNTTIDFPITVNAVGATVQLQDNLTIGSTRTFTLTNGTLDLSSGNRTLSTGLFSSSNSNTRSILFGTGTITLTGNNATIFTLTTYENFSYTGTPKFIANYSGSTGSRQFSGPTAPTLAQSAAVDIYITAGSDNIILVGSTAYGTVNFTGFSGTLNTVTVNRGIWRDLIFSSTMTVTSGTAQGFSFLATSGTQQVTTNGITIACRLAFNGAGGVVAFQDALTQDSASAFVINNGTVQLKAATNNSIGTMSATGGSLQTTTAGTKANITALTTTPTYATNLTVKDCWVSPGGVFNAYTGTGSTTVGAASSGCVNAGNNQGWYFIPPGASFFF
jgi:hypothetical protein